MKKYLGLLTIGLFITLPSCSDQAKAAYGQTVTVDTLPKDICLIDGKPQVISVSIENGEDIDFSYFSTDAKIVNLKYGGGILRVGTREQGRLEWQMSKPLTCDK